MSSSGEKPLSLIFSDIVQLSTESIIPKLPFVPEEKESSKLRAFFTKGDENSQITTSKRKENLQKILNLLNNASQKDYNNSKENYSKAWALLFVFLGEQQNGFNEWSSAENAQLVSEIVKIIQSNFLHKTSNDDNNPQLESLFLQDFENTLTLKDTIFNHALRILKGKIKSNEWTYFPAATNAFTWILKQIKYPHLSDFVDDILPPALLMTDDFNLKNKITGLDCIYHCIHNVNKAELQRNNWTFVIYDALLKLINDNEIIIIDKLAPTLLKVLSIIEEDPHENCYKLTKYDDTLKKIMFAMEVSGQLQQKKAWLTHLITYLEKMGLASLHWVNRVNSMLLSSTTCNDSEMWLLILMCIEVCIKNTWVKPSSKAFTEIILRIIFNQSVLGSNHNEKILQMIFEKTCQCFELLSKCEDFEEVEKEVQEILDSGDSKLLHLKFLNELQKYNLSRK